MNVTHRLLNAKLTLRKGEGIYRLDPETGEAVYIGNPHEHLFHDNPDNPLHQTSETFAQYGMDVPLHAHLGDRTPDGKWGVGKHGEIVWTDSYGHTHRHGIDGVIHKLGEMGVKNPVALVQRAIDHTNENHTDGETHGMPGVHDKEWRQLVGHDYSASHDLEHAMEYPYRGLGGTLATVNMSADPEAPNANVKLGQHPESYRIGFAPVLRQMLKDEEGIEIQPDDYHEGIERGYISGGHLSFDASGSPVVRRLRGRYGESLTPQGLLPHNAAKELGVTENHPQPFQEGVHTWEMFHGLPALLLHPEINDQYKQAHGKKKGGRTHSAKGYATYFSQIAPKMLQNSPPEVLNVPILSTPNGETLTLGDALQDQTGIEMLTRELVKSPAALSFLLGNADQAGAANWVLTDMENKLLSSMSEEQRKEYQMSLMGVTPGNAPGAQSKNSHSLGARLFALSHHIEPGEMKNFGFEPDEEQHPWFERQDGLFGVVADSLAHAHGHQPRRQTVDVPDYSDVNLPRGLADSMDPNRPLDPHWQEKVIPKHASEQEDMVDESQPPADESDALGLAPPAESDNHKKFWDSFHNRFTPEEQMQVMNHFVNQGTYKHPQGVLGAQGIPMLSPEDQLNHFIESQKAQQESAPIATSFDTVPVEDRIIKGMEKMQMIQAKSDVAVIKRVSDIPVDTDKFSFLADKMGLQKQDIRAIAHSKGDWSRVAKAYDTRPVLVKAVKLSLEDE